MMVLRLRAPDAAAQVKIDRAGLVGDDAAATVRLMQRRPLD
jgi:hypothetical protein